MAAYATIMGEIYAGIDEDDIGLCSMAIVIEFDTQEEVRQALREGACAFAIGPKPEENTND